MIPGTFTITHRTSNSKELHKGDLDKEMLELSKQSEGGSFSCEDNQKLRLTLGDNFIMVSLVTIH